MPRKWTLAEEKQKTQELHRLYVKENKTIGEIAKILKIAEQTVFDRMQRLDIESTPEKKKTYAARRRRDIKIPKQYSERLAEFFGVMLGDGNLSKYQVIICLGKKELDYARYLVELVHLLFGAKPKIAQRKNGCRDIYLGSLSLTEWLQKKGLVYNKVLSQVNAPDWIFTKSYYIKNFLKGFFDTDGSVYKLRFGIQLSFTNKSIPLLKSLRRGLICLNYHPSNLSKFAVYLTRRIEVKKFFNEIKPANPKHWQRFKLFFSEKMQGQKRR